MYGHHRPNNVKNREPRHGSEIKIIFGWIYLHLFIVNLATNNMCIFHVVRGVKLNKKLCLHSEGMRAVTGGNCVCVYFRLIFAAFHSRCERLRSIESLSVQHASRIAHAALLAKNFISSQLNGVGCLGFLLWWYIAFLKSQWTSGYMKRLSFSYGLL